MAKHRRSTANQDYFKVGGRESDPDLLDRAKARVKSAHEKHEPPVTTRRRRAQPRLPVEGGERIAPPAPSETAPPTPEPTVTRARVPWLAFDRVADRFRGRFDRIQRLAARASAEVQEYALIARETLRNVIDLAGVLHQAGPRTATPAGKSGERE